MDKNTLWGLLLMGAIFFGFYYINQPSPEQLEAQRQAQEMVQASQVEAQAVATPELTDTITLAQAVDLSEAVRQLGAITDDGSHTLIDGNIALKLDNKQKLSGTINDIDIDELTDSKSKIEKTARAAAVKVAKELINKHQKYNSLARHLGGENTQMVLENDLVKVTFDTRGAMVSSVVLKQHMTELTAEPSPIELFHGATDGYGFIMTTADQRLDTREFNFKPIAESDTSLIMALDLGEGAQWAVRYTLSPDNYLVGMEVMQKGIGKILPASTSSIDFNWHQELARNEKGRTFEERNSGIHYKYVGEAPDELNSMDNDSEQLNGRVKWVAFKNQFFSSVVVARNYFSNANVASTLIEDNTYLKDLNLTASLPYTIADGTAAAFDFYFGPNEYQRLSDLDEAISPDEDLNLTRLIPLGWSLFRWINTWIVIPVFNFLSDFGLNLGIVILLLTIFIKLIIFPFTFKSFQSQARMRVLQPEIKEINDKYPGDENAMKRQQETMALYSRTGASPFSGCLPMLLQMPVLIAMFSFLPAAIELRGQSFLWAHDLSAPDFIVTLPFSIPFYGNGVSLFCLLMTIVNVVYMHINMQNQPSSSSMPGMKFMTYMMPVMFLFIFNDYASGLSYYYLLSMLITIIQTWIFRRCIDEQKVRAELLENAKKPRKKSGWMARLEEAQRQQQAAMRQQQGKGKGKR